MNRLNIKSIFAVVAIASVTFTSCDGYLETFPSDSLVSTDAITTLQDVETALNGTYYSLKSANYYGCDFVSRAEVGGEDVQTIFPVAQLLQKGMIWSSTTWRKR